MLHELVVENYAVVERARIRFHAGFNLLTGETGSGKSIVVGALGLLFGGRASTDVIRAGAASARVSGIFDAPQLPESFGIEAEDGELILEREVQSTGKSRAFVNGRPMAASTLRELAPLLGDIHGQHDRQELFEESTQRELLDAFGALDRSKVAAAFEDLRAVEAELRDLERAEQERLRMSDLWTFQKKEIDLASPSAGEDGALEREKKLLANVTRLSAAAEEAYTALQESPESALASLRIAVKRTEELARIDGSLAETLEAIRSAEIALNDCAYTLRDYLGRLEADPARLEEVESRLAALDKLKRKYGTTLDEVLAYRAQVAESLAQAETAEDRVRELRTKRDTLAAEYAKYASELTQERRGAAKKLEKKVEAELRPLAMEGTRLQIAIIEAPPSAHGSDRVTFLVSPNAGEEPRPMEKVLSGGELSRLALALKCVATSPQSKGSTLVFDEVDAGIGGAVAEAVGKRLKRIAADHQVLCVTHLAQIAAFGDHHYVVEKRESRGRTIAEVEELTREQRVKELGRMLAGDRLTPEVLKHAEQLIS